MRRYNVVSWTLPILTVITFALAAPTLVQDKRRAYVDVVHVPKDVITVLEKRMDDDIHDIDLWANEAIGYYHNVWGHLHPGGIHLEPPPPPNVPPPHPADLIELDDDAPAWSSESEGSHSEPPSPGSSTKSEDFHTAPSSPRPDSDSDSDPRSPVSNAPNTESQSENVKASDTEMEDKAKVERRISDSVESDAVNAAEMELRSTVEPGWLCRGVLRNLWINECWES